MIYKSATVNTELSNLANVKKKKNTPKYYWMDSLANITKVIFQKWVFWSHPVSLFIFILYFIH